VAGAWALQLGHVVWPFDFLTWYSRVPGDPPTWAMVVAPALTLLALAMVLRRAPAESPARAGALLFVVAYAPSSAFFRSHRWVADSYMYVPIAALALAVTPALARVWPPRLRAFGYATGAMLVAGLAALSFTYALRWSSAMRLWAGSIARYPNLALSYEHEALALRHDGHPMESNALFIELAVKFPDWDDTYDDELLAYESFGRYDHANEVFARGIRRGSPGCLRIFWLRYLSTSKLPSFADRELVSIAFDKGFDAMKAGLSSSVAFHRIAALLDSLGLHTEARRADAHAAQLARAGK
jgi:hypothetical protein